MFQEICKEKAIKELFPKNKIQVVVRTSWYLNLARVTKNLLINVSSFNSFLASLNNLLLLTRLFKSLL